MEPPGHRAPGLQAMDKIISSGSDVPWISCDFAYFDTNRLIPTFPQLFLILPIPEAAIY